MPFGIQPIHLVIIAIVALLLFGPKSLPEIGHWIGRTMVDFRQGAKDLTEAVREESDKAAQPSKTNAPTAATSAANPPAPAVSSPRESPAANKSCTRCGATNASDSAFCNKCGNPFPS